MKEKITVLLSAFIMFHSCVEEPTSTVAESSDTNSDPNPSVTLNDPSGYTFRLTSAIYFSDENNCIGQTCECLGDTLVETSGEPINAISTVPNNYTDWEFKFDDDSVYFNYLGSSSIGQESIFTWEIDNNNNLRFKDSYFYDGQDKVLTTDSTYYIDSGSSCGYVSGSSCWDEDTKEECMSCNGEWEDCTRINFIGKSEWGCSETIDCDGVCGGSAYNDNCGECDDDTSNDCIQDCEGVWGGSANCLVGNWLYDKREEYGAFCMGGPYGTAIDYSTFEYKMYLLFKEGNKTCTVTENSEDSNYCVCNESDYTLFGISDATPPYTDTAFQKDALEYPYSIVTEGDITTLIYWFEIQGICYQYSFTKSETTPECPQ